MTLVLDYGVDQSQFDNLDEEKINQIIPKSSGILFDFKKKFTEYLRQNSQQNVTNGETLNTSNSSISMPSVVDQRRLNSSSENQENDIETGFDENEAPGSAEFIEIFNNLELHYTQRTKFNYTFLHEI